MFWSLSMHDSHNGCLRSIALSFDDKYILTGGGDSNVFLFELSQKQGEHNLWTFTQAFSSMNEVSSCSYDCNDCAS